MLMKRGSKRRRWIVAVAAGMTVAAVIAAVVAVWCKPRTSPEASELMSRAEAVMVAHPDSALTLLESMDADDVRGKADRARYALLMSMALDKNYIDTTTFDILQPAIDYYEKHGTPDERLKTRYYEGRIYMNRGEDDAALTSFLRAAEDSARCTDRRALALLLIAEGHMYYKEWAIDRFAICNLQAANIFKDLKDDKNRLACLGRYLDGLIVTDNDECAKSIMPQAYDGVMRYRDTIPSLVSSLIEGIVKYEDKSNFYRLLPLFATDSILPKELGHALVYAFCSYGEPKMANSILNRTTGIDSISIYALQTDIYEQLGDTSKALEAYRNYIRIEQEAQTQLMNDSLLFTRKKYELRSQNERKVAEQSARIWLYAGIAVIAIAGAIFIYWLLTKRLHRGNNLQAELSEEIKKLKVSKKAQKINTSQLKILLAEKTAVLNALISEKSGDNNDESLKETSSENEAIAAKCMGIVASIQDDFKVLHPKFMEFLIQHQLTEDEINYVCLYCLGMRGKEIGTLFNKTSFYNTNHKIRRKLNISGRTSQLGKSLRKLCDEL